MASSAAIMPATKGAVYPPRNGKPKSSKKPGYVSTSQERLVRESIRKIIFLSKIKFYENKGKQYLQEQALRGAIRKLLKEEVSPEFKTTGEAYGWTAFKRVLQGLKTSYSKLKTTAEQRKKFLETIESVIPEYLDLLDAQRGLPVEKEEEPEPTGPEPVTAPVIPGGDNTETEEPEEEPSVGGGDVAAGERKTALRTAAGQALSAAGADTASPDATGQTEAYSALRTALPQIGEEYEKLSLDSDRKSFRMFIFGKPGQPGTLQLTMAAFEKELLAKNPAAGQAAPAKEAPAEPPEAETDVAEPGLGDDEEPNLDGDEGSNSLAPDEEEPEL